MDNLLETYNKVCKKISEKTHVPEQSISLYKCQTKRKEMFETEGLISGQVLGRVKNDENVLILSQNRRNVKMIEAAVAKDAGNYVYLATKKEISDLVAQINGNGHEIIKIKGLSPLTMQLFEKKCAHIVPGFVLGKEQDGETYNAYITDYFSTQKGPTGENSIRALISAIIESTGPLLDTRIDLQNEDKIEDDKNEIIKAAIKEKRVIRYAEMLINNYIIQTGLQFESETARFSYFIKNMAALLDEKSKSDVPEYIEQTMEQLLKNENINLDDYDYSFYELNNIVIDTVEPEKERSEMTKNTPDRGEAR